MKDDKGMRNYLIALGLLWLGLALFAIMNLTS
jgi:hypothetical protein